MKKMNDCAVLIMKEDFKIKLIKESELLRRFSDSECRIFCSEVKPQLKQYTKNEILIYEGEELNFIGIVRTGKINGEKFYLEGDVHLVYVYECGELFGLDTAATHSRLSPVTFLADKNSSVLMISMDRIMNCSFREKIMENIISILADENIKKLYKIEALSKRGLRDRIMTYLRIRQHKLGRDSFSIMMTQEQFAQYLCVNRSALTYELNNMRREGIIDFKRDRFTILQN